MKGVAIAVLFSATLASAAHHHQRHHHEKRDVPDKVKVVNVPGPTVVVYELNGNLVTEEEVQQGLANGTLVMAPNGQLSSASSSSYVAPSTSSQYWEPSSSSSSVYVAPTSTEESISSYSADPTTSSTSEYVAPTTTWSSAESSTSSTSTTSSAAAASSSSSSSSGGSGVDLDFPDGTLDCSDFPDEYGPIAVNWLGLGGWTGVQTPGSILGGLLDDITTAISGESCTEGAYCSYACPAGYQKSQWPSTQGATGQSVGGIHCSGGKLWLTNTAMSSKLCMTGTTEVTVQVVNKLSTNAAVCRTDYPGTESETVPLNTLSGQTYPLTCPDASNYYNWKGGHTSAQYYVNNAGVSESDACQWGSDANPWGNFAPLNLGVGYSGGRAWLSIFQNSPTTDAQLDFTVELQGDNMSGSCKYSNGQYCSDTGCSSTTGCTVSVSSGTASFVFS